MKQLNVSIDLKGKVKVEVEGVSGSSCQDLTKELLQKLGGKVEDEVLKTEYYLSNKERNWETY